MSQKIIQATLLTALLQFITATSWAQQNVSKKNDTTAQTSVVIDQKALTQSLEQMDSEDNGPDSEPSSFALDGVEDTGTPGHKKIELNVFVNCDRVNSANHSCEKVVDGNIGIGEKLELTVSKSMVNETSDEGQFTGKGPTELGVKYRFYDKNGITAAVVPTYVFDDAAKRFDSEGNEVPSEGSAVYIPLVLSKKVNKDGYSYTITGNIGYTKSMLSSNNDKVSTAIAVGRSLGDKTRIIGAVTTETELGTHETTKNVQIGFVRYVGKVKNYEASVFGTIGRTVGQTPEGLPHTTYNMGLNIAPK